MYIDPIESMRIQNKQKITQLTPGMSRDDIFRIMGTETAGGILGPMLHTRINNPYRAELVTGIGNKNYEVLFYYTDVVRKDDVVTGDELTPVVLEEGKMVGHGYDFLESRVPKYKGRR
jgi:hypothetical protein